MKLWRWSIALALGVSSLGILLVDCGGEKDPDPALPPGDPQTAAMAVFDVARSADPDRETVALIFDATRLTESMAALLDAIAPLAEASEPRVIAEVAMPEVHRIAIDIEADLPGGGSAIFGVQAEQQLDGTWRVVSVLGPGVEWPARPPGRNGSTTTSPLP